MASLLRYRKKSHCWKVCCVRRLDARVGHEVQQVDDEFGMAPGAKVQPAHLLVTGE